MPALSRLIVNFDAAGALILAVGLLLLGVISVAGAEFLPNLQPIPATFEVPSNAACLNGVLIAALATGMLVSRVQAPAAALQAAYFSTWLFVAQLPQLCLGTFEMTGLVNLLELAAIVAVLMILAIGKDARSAVPAKLGRSIFACMLLVSAVVNIQGPDPTSPIPEWAPLDAMWPWIAASANLTIGISFLGGIKHQIAGALLSVIYALAVPILYLPRLLSNPSSVGAWSACALTIALAGAALLVSREYLEADTKTAAPPSDGGRLALD